MDWVSMENELPSLHKMWSLQVRAQVRGKEVLWSCFDLQQRDWSEWLSGALKVLLARGAWGADLPCRDRAHPMGTPKGLEPALLPVPCDPVGRLRSWHRALSPSQAHCSPAHSSLCSSEVSKPSCDAAEHGGVGGGDPEAKLGLNHCPGLNRAKFGLL